jgi:NSS family neurotransmitter:Na+ symporter
MESERFSSRWGIILASLGMAIGAGNLWRFPRLAGEYGGAFLLLWVLFLLIWSIPILLVEFSLGKRHKKGVVGAFCDALGPRWAWVGFFVAVCTLGICFYYSVVTGWGLQYLGFSLANLWQDMTGGTSLATRVASEPDFLTSYWQGISNANPLTVVLHATVVLAGALVLSRGIRRGLEAANRVLIPGLFVLLLIIMVISLRMENGVTGLEYLFSIDTSHFGAPKIWLEALSQSAWSTGAGWGLMMTISSYSREREDVTLNIFIGAFGNNTASLIAAMAILPAVFALAPDEAQAVSYLQSGNQALTFSVIPLLFGGMPGGHLLAAVFFVAFTLAAFSSLLPMMELAIRNLGDLGLARHAATWRAAVLVIVFGFPSAWHLGFFSNQDWVWGVGLIVSGLAFVFAALKEGPVDFKRNIIDQDSDFRVPDTYFVACLAVNAVLGCVLIWWWMSRGYSENPWFDAEGHWNVFDTYSNATVVTQWGAVLLAGMVMNRFLARRFGAGAHA